MDLTSDTVCKQISMIYFSYGSNMSMPRLHARLPSALRLDTGILMRHRLRFHKVSTRDGSAKCDIEETGDNNHRVYGVLFEITEREKADLDRFEGLGTGYAQKKVGVELPDGARVQAVTYYATLIDPTLRPFDWYKEHVLRGARANALPEGYIQSIEAIPSIPDADLERYINELSIYR